MSDKVLDCRGCVNVRQLDKHIDAVALQNAVVFVGGLPDRLVVTQALARAIREYHKLDATDKLEHRAIPCEVRG